MARRNRRENTDWRYQNFRYGVVDDEKDLKLVLRLETRYAFGDFCMCISNGDADSGERLRIGPEHKTGQCVTDGTHGSGTTATQKSASRKTFKRQS